MGGAMAWVAPTILMPIFFHMRLDLSGAFAACDFV